MKPLVSTIAVAALLAFVAAPASAAPVQPAGQVGSQNSISPDASRCSAKAPTARQRSLGKGQCLQGWSQKKALKDYSKRGLRAPGKGRQWVENNGVYVLVDITTGIIQQIVKPR